MIEIDLSELEPYINGPFTPDAATPISEFAEKVLLNGYPRKMEVGLIGSCTNSSYQDLSRAASIAREALEKDIAVAAPLIVNPGSEQIRATAERDGMITLFQQNGATIMANACGPCIGQWKRHTDDPNRKNSIVTSFNRNFCQTCRWQSEYLCFCGFARDRDGTYHCRRSLFQSAERPSDDARWREGETQ